MTRRIGCSHPCGLTRKIGFTPAGKQRWTCGMCRQEMEVRLRDRKRLQLSAEQLALLAKSKGPTPPRRFTFEEDDNGCRA